VAILKRLILKILTLSILIYGFLSVIVVFGAEAELYLNFGEKPIIDGYIDRSTGEWNDALKSKIDIYQNLSNPRHGLEIDLWILQNETNLYISVQFELVDHKSSEYDNEFVGILTSNDESIDPLEFEDAKIVQFFNMTEETFEYRDYYINQSQFYSDSEINGDGAAHLDGERIVYEFQLPVENSEDPDEDIRIEAGILSPFMIIFGKSQNYNDEIILKQVISLFVQFYAYNPRISAEELIYLSLASIILLIIFRFESLR